MNTGKHNTDFSKGKGKYVLLIFVQKMGRGLVGSGRKSFTRPLESKNK